VDRKLYELTPNDELKCHPGTMPTDEEFGKGRIKSWGMKKRDWCLSNLKFNREYVRGLWQGRVDVARGLDYSEERTESAYNLGYYRGFTSYWSDRNGWDAGTRERFDAQYAN
jgi:hypothetical protein